MPWEKNVDTQDAMEKAMYVFWEQGYESTSISGLMEATGVPRQRLYNAFGGKRQLFIQALRKLESEHQRNVLAARDQKTRDQKTSRCLRSKPFSTRQ